jgi:hypothetical protein
MACPCREGDRRGRAVYHLLTSFLVDSCDVYGCCACLGKQTTSYHPESNGAVKRLHCRLKDALRARSAAATWSEELPFVLLGLRAQPREHTGLSPAEAVFGAPIVLPYEFLQNEEMSVDAIIKFFFINLACACCFFA